MKTQDKKQLVFKKKDVVELSTAEQLKVIGGAGDREKTEPTRFTPPFCDAIN